MNMGVPQVTGEALAAVRRERHGRCVVCGRRPAGLGLDFRLTEDQAVTAEFACSADFQGYDGMLHGGVISAILDGAMTNCLFAHGVSAVTAELNVRFRHAVRIGEFATVTARLIRSARPLFVLAAELIQDGQRKATAGGKFMETRG